MSAERALHPAGGGCTVTGLSLPSLQAYQAASLVIMTCEAYSLHEAWLRERAGGYGEILRARLLLGVLLTSADYLWAVRRRHELCAITTTAAADVDVLVTLGAADEAPEIEAVPGLGYLKKPGFYHPFNLTGWPAISVRSGFGGKGLPLSI